MTDSFPHGEERGYQRHRRQGTHREADACGCKAAHSLYVANRALLKRRLAGVLPPTAEELVSRFPANEKPEIVGWRKGKHGTMTAIYAGEENG